MQSSHILHSVFIYQGCPKSNAIASVCDGQVNANYFRAHFCAPLTIAVCDETIGCGWVLNFDQLAGPEVTLIIVLICEGVSMRSSSFHMDFSKENLRLYA